KGDSLPNGFGRSRQQLGLESPRRRRQLWFSWFTERGRRSNPGDAHESPSASRSGERDLRSSDAFLWDGVHHGTFGPAGKTAEKHSPEVLRGRPHDVSGG